MSETNATPEKEDYLDVGPMGRYDDQTKPFCVKCESQAWVVATGKDHKWEWCCTNCQTRWKP